ncbi:MAG: tRNA uridine-5-carboxymethylaminomethyl(34) synthesis GTPase MnmE [Candidatus Kapabacteria bacterium]|nr:tRNA uridine-5-carboxymethylaminomethyl(34) synthesis GTPase MnmE [Candidatus Kapabacteria bacterium]
MLLLHDAICALTTPPGVSGIAVVRLSGEGIFDIAAQCFRSKTPLADVPSHTIHYGTWRIGTEAVDTVTVAVFRAPASYTGDDTLEISCHGGYFVAQQILSSLCAGGARIAEPGEFTKRAFLNGKMDLTQVESVAEIIHAASTSGSQIAARQLTGSLKRSVEELRSRLIRTCSLLELELDFAHEDIEFTDRSEINTLLDDCLRFCHTVRQTYHATELIKNGFKIGLMGFPNAGKSTLFNMLVGRERAITNPTPGTTRDYLEDAFEVNGFRVLLYDTAGIRESDDAIEVAGINLSRTVLAQCHAIIIVNDISLSADHSDDLMRYATEHYPDSERLLVQNKADLIAGASAYSGSGILLSALRSEGREELLRRITACVMNSMQPSQQFLINQRQSSLFANVEDSIRRSQESIANGMSGEFVTLDIRRAIDALGQISGERYDEEILNSIFANFCIGK